MRRLLVVALLLVASMLGLSAIAVAAPAGYAALGDSYSSGVGTGSYTLSSSCKRGTKAYPYLYSGTATGFVACSGADVNSVRSTQLSATAGALLVTMTVGGNDIGFSTVVSNCTVFSSDTTCRNAVNTAVAKIPAMKANLITLLTQIRSNAPAARIVVLGYPYLYSTGSCGAGQPGLVKRTALHNGADALDAALATAVGDAGVTGSKTFVDVRPAFTGHDICASSSQRWLNGLNIFNSGESFHPNTAGHAQGYLPALTGALASARV
jgi:lysophospholipase L1-like esterase